MGKNQGGIGLSDSGSLASIMARLVGRPYCLGDLSRGLDCFSLIYQHIELMGYTMPAEFEGMTLGNYADLFLSDSSRAKEIMLGFVRSMLECIPPSRAFAGDVLVLRIRAQGPAMCSAIFLGIHGGGTNVVSATEEHGVSVYPLQGYEIMEAYRCRQQSR